MGQSRPAQNSWDLDQAERRESRRFTGRVYDLLIQEYGEPQTPLQYRKPHELVIAVILSAQCTDEQVNRVTPDLFRRFPDVDDYISGPISELEEAIYSTGFYKNKAKSIRGFCRALKEDFGGTVPNTIEDLVKMPGVGRKTANVVLNELYGKATGIVVDTHVARISRILGLTPHKDAVKVERDLMARVSERHWLHWPLLIIFLGRSHCTARKRHCSSCPLKRVCPSADA